MNTENEFLKFPSDRFIPITKTPWGGTQIPTIKKRYLSSRINHIPTHIGESVEAMWENFLLKWIEATEPLSVQVHPTDSNPHLAVNECGKSEAWFVYALQNPSPVYIGFKDGLSQAEIINCLKSSNPIDCLHAFIPKKHDYISIPPGCVHCLGSGILAAEPQIIIPNKEGKTFRIFDWNRLYNKNGIKSEHGLPRELHTETAISAIDWTLPRGSLIDTTLVKNLNQGEKFLGNQYNPFCVQLFEREISTAFEPLIENKFSIVTVFSGKFEISTHSNSFSLIGGETGLIKQSHEPMNMQISAMFTEKPCVLIFSLK